MDKRLKLTREQEELAKKFNELCAKMKAAGIGFINDAFNGDVLLLNLTNAEESMEADEISEDDESCDEQIVDMEELFLTHIGFFYSTGAPDNFFGIRFKK